MTEIDTASTDLVLALECAVLATLLFRQGSASPLVRHMARLIAALGAAAALGGIYHGFFSGTTDGLGGALWQATLLALAAVTMFLWIAGAAIQLGPRGRRRVAWIAGLQAAGFVAAVLLGVRSFHLASANLLPAMLFLTLGYVRVLHRTGDIRVRAGLFGLLVALAGAGLQTARIGLHPEYFGHNALYHVLQGIAVLLIYLSLPGLTAAHEKLALSRGISEA